MFFAYVNSGGVELCDLINQPGFADGIVLVQTLVGCNISTRVKFINNATAETDWQRQELRTGGKHAWIIIIGRFYQFNHHSSSLEWAVAYAE